MGRRQDTAEQIRKALVAAQRERRVFADPDVSFIEHEHRAVMDAANAILGRYEVEARIDLGEIGRLEVSALGHADYTLKFSYYVADRVMEMIRETFDA